jgi:hypothetical protein
VNQTHCLLAGAQSVDGVDECMCYFVNDRVGMHTCEERVDAGYTFSVCTLLAYTAVCAGTHTEPVF